eukprot:Tbor_TRINITY_DN5281_c1_g1::TRINITY_DN5281_c1_g1_i1::g.16495::m.16495
MSNRIHSNLSAVPGGLSSASLGTFIPSKVEQYEFDQLREYVVYLEGLLADMTSEDHRRDERNRISSVDYEGIDNDAILPSERYHDIIMREQSLNTQLRMRISDLDNKLAVSEGRNQEYIEENMLLEEKLKECDIRNSVKSNQTCMVCGEGLNRSPLYPVCKRETENELKSRLEALSEVSDQHKETSEVLIHMVEKLKQAIDMSSDERLKRRAFQILNPHQSTAVSRSSSTEHHQQPSRAAYHRNNNSDNGEKEREYSSDRPNTGASDGTREFVASESSRDQGTTVNNHNNNKRASGSRAVSDNNNNNNVNKHTESISYSNYDEGGSNSQENSLPSPGFKVGVPMYDDEEPIIYHNDTRMGSRTPQMESKLEKAKSIAKEKQDIAMRSAHGGKAVRHSATTTSNMVPINMNTIGGNVYRPTSTVYDRGSNNIRFLGDGYTGITRSALGDNRMLSHWVARNSGYGTLSPRAHAVRQLTIAHHRKPFVVPAKNEYTKIDD